MWQRHNGGSCGLSQGACPGSLATIAAASRISPAKDLWSACAAGGVEPQSAEEYLCCHLLITSPHNWRILEEVHPMARKI